MSVPLITVLISTYNDRLLVPKKLAEIRRQSLFEQAEFIFLETNSPERERELLAPFCSKYAQCRLITSDERKTLYEAWNLGWEAARAPLVCNSNMDDVMHPRLLEYVVAAMSRQTWQAATVLIVKTTLGTSGIDWNSKAVANLPLSLRPGPFTVWRRELKETVGMFDGEFVAAGDKDFWSRLLANRCSLGLIPKVLYCYCKGPKQLSKTNGSKRKQQDAARISTKPYSHRWSGKIRWQIFFLRYLYRYFPNYFKG